MFFQVDTINITQPDTFRVKKESDNKKIYFRYILQDFQTDVSFLVCPMDSSRKSPTQNKTAISENRYDID